MKKILTASLLLTMLGIPAAFAATDTNTTYTEQFIQRHTQKVIDAEKKLQEQQKASEEASAARRQSAKDAWETKKQEIKKQHENTQKAWEAKKQEWQEQQKANQAESEKNKKEIQQKIEKKKQAWKDLLSE